MVVLRLYGEHVYPVPPLELAPLDGKADPARLDQAQAMRLLVGRARAVRPDFALTAENLKPAPAICRQLDGIRLAIERAAARLKQTKSRYNDSVTNAVPGE